MGVLDKTKTVETKTNEVLYYPTVSRFAFIREDCSKLEVAEDGAYHAITDEDKAILEYQRSIGHAQTEDEFKSSIEAMNQAALETLGIE